MLKPLEEQNSSKQRIINLRFTHKNCSVTLLDSLTFKNPRKATVEILKKAALSEALLLQTCNRIELYAIVDRDPTEAKAAIVEYWLSKIEMSNRDFQNHLEESIDREALRHVLRLTAGLESMLIGEDQILGQIRNSFIKSKTWGTIGTLLDQIFTKAIRSGGQIRAKTGINRGPVSLGSAAVNMTARILSGLRGKQVMIIGAGETGTLVGKALAARKHDAIYVANRTFNRAKRLARILGGRAIHYNKIDTILPSVDVVFVATSAPHMTLKKKQVACAMTKREGRKMLIFDLSQPRNVEADVVSIKGVKLLNIDILQNIARENMKTRLKELETAEHLVETDLKNLEMSLNRRELEPLISMICSWAEEIRQREFLKACKMLGEIDSNQRKIVERLTRVIIEKLLYNTVSSLRRAADNGESELHKVALTLFGLEIDGGKK